MSEPEEPLRPEAPRHTPQSEAPSVSLRTVAGQWGRIGVTGFGGPPAHIALLRRLVVDERGWLSSAEFEAAISACNLLPGPASTQLAIFCAYRVGGRRGAVVGGLAFIVPAVVIVVALSTLFLAKAPPAWIVGAGAGAGAGIAPVAVCAAIGLLVPSFKRARDAPVARRARWLVYVLLGGAAAALLGPFLVLVLVGCGAAELVFTAPARDRLTAHGPLGLILFGTAASVTVGGIGALAWEALKVGALSYGGGFVIVPLMQTDAVHTYHWMTSAQFLNAVALGQVSPGPVVATVAAVGYAAHGIGGAALAALIAFLPSFVFVLVGARHFERLRAAPRAQAFLDGAGPAAIGAILGSAIPLTRALHHGWQFAVLAAAAVALLLARRGVVETLVGAGVVGAGLALAGVAV